MGDLMAGCSPGLVITEPVRPSASPEPRCSLRFALPKQKTLVLYPGRANEALKLKGFHEILPGLGAFGVAPDENGNAQGLETLSQSLDDVLGHLGNVFASGEQKEDSVVRKFRTTAADGKTTKRSSTTSMPSSRSASA